MTKHTKGRARAAQADTTPAAAPARKTEVKITAAKGRPMLVWVGKRPLARVTAFPAQHVETFDPNGALGRKPRDRPGAGQELRSDERYGRSIRHEPAHAS